MAPLWTRKIHHRPRLPPCPASSEWRGLRYFFNRICIRTDDLQRYNGQYARRVNLRALSSITIQDATKFEVDRQNNQAKRDRLEMTVLSVR